MEQLLSELQQRGIGLAVEGEALRVSAPAGALDDGLRDALRLHKPRLLALLRAQAVGGAQPAAWPAHDAEGRHEPFPLTPLQRAYWLGRNGTVELGGVATHLYVEQTCHGLDLERLGDALNRLIERHDMLRAVLDGEGQQRVLPQVPRYRIAVADAPAVLAATRGQLSHQVLDPQRWPLFDIRATRLPGGAVCLHLSLDLLILDAASIAMFLREWRALYDGAALPALPAFTFRDWVLSRQAAAAGQRGEAARAYWAARIGALPPAPELPLRSRAGAVRAPRFRRREWRVPCASWERIKSQGRRRGLTPACMVMSAYGEVLARWSAMPRFTLNVTIDLRDRGQPGAAGILGDFTSMVLHEVDRSRTHEGFAAFAAAQQQRLLQDLAHADADGTEVRREWARRHGVAPGAAMPVVFTSLLGLGDFGVSDFGDRTYGLSQTSQVWLDHQCTEDGGDLLLVWDAVDDAFMPGVLDAMFASYAALFGRLADEGGAWDRTGLAGLPAAMQLRREALNRTAVDLSRQGLHAALVERAAACPGAVAVVTPGRTLRYGELLAESAAVADRLLAGGVAAGEPVAVLMRKGWEQVVGVLGVLLAGGAYVPVDADLPPRRQRELLGLCGVRQVLTQPGLPDAALQEGPWMVHALRPGEHAACGERHRRSLLDAPDRPAYVIFTSGTTGVPKGVVIGHAAAHNTVEAVNRLFDVGTGDAVLGLSSLSFDLSVYDIFGVLGAGGTLVLPGADRAHDPVHWCELMHTHGITLWNSAPQLMRMLLDGLAPGEALPGALRTVLLSGDFTPLDTADRLRHHGCTAELVSLGGATEAAIWSVFHRVRGIDPAWHSIPYGRPLPNQTICVLDSALRPTPDHVRGRIHIGGAGLAQGYLGDEALTASRFITHPASGERLYDTGDFGFHAEDGSVVILGRDDGQVKIRGHRVELGEIEAVLCRHPAVSQAAVVAPLADGARQLVAYVQPGPGADAAALEAGLREHLAERLPAYMLPRRIVPLARLPLSANGKLDLRALPEPAERAAAPVRMAPRNDAEAAIHAIWQRVLPSAEIGVTDSFFELGGDSVLATQLLLELNAMLPQPLQMHELFDGMTIEALAAMQP